MVKLRSGRRKRSGLVNCVGKQQEIGKNLSNIKKITKEASETRGCENKRFRLLVWTPSPAPPPASEVNEKPLQERSRDLTGYELHHSETTLVAG